MPEPMLRSAATTVWVFSHRMSKSPPPEFGTCMCRRVNVRPPLVDRHRLAGSEDDPRPSTSTVRPSGEIETLGSPPADGNTVVVVARPCGAATPATCTPRRAMSVNRTVSRSEEHTSELQSPMYL